MKGISKRVGVGLLSMLFMLALVSAMPVEAKVPLRWEGTATYDGMVTWNGDIIREDGGHGTLTWSSLDSVFLSNVQHSSSSWRIDWDDDGYIEGTAEGTWVYNVVPHDYFYGGDYVYNGKVTGASSDWADLVGRKVHIMGHVSPWWWTTEAVFQIN